ncbi:MAG: NADH-quinone oxidoreductase subunit M [Chloroflexi bacterium]|nr:NADH-quinone oxidoreductase subunit M [Chloroflexota bacterium]
MNGSLLITLIAIPAGAAVAVLLIPRTEPELIKRVCLLAATAALAMSILAFVRYDHNAGGYQFHQEWKWIPNLGITLSLGVDGISTPLVLLTGIVMFTGVLVSWSIQDRSKEYFILFMVLVAGVYGTFVTTDLFFLFFFYELAVLPMYLLIAVWGSTRKEYGALKLVMYLVAGSVLVWITLAAIFAKADIGSFNLVDLQNVHFAREFQRIFFPLLMIGFGVLAGLWPFHTWSPDGHVAAPTAVSMLHAGVLMKLGAYGILRVGMTLFPQGADFWQIPFITLATVNVVYGAFAAMAQRDLKYVIGYSSVAHMGLVLVGLATFDKTGMGGAVLQMVAHGIMTALFFAVVGIIYERAHTRDITVFQGLSKRMGATAVLFTIAGLSSLGLPGLAGFVAEVQVLIGAFRVYPVVGVLGVIAAMLTAVYILRLIGSVFFGPLEQKWADITDGSRREIFAGSLLACGLLFIGFWPMPFMNVINSGVSTLASRLAGSG